MPMVTLEKGGIVADEEFATTTEDGQQISGMSYKEWEVWKKKQEQKNVDISSKKGIIKEKQKIILSKEETIEKAKIFANSEDYNNIHSFVDLRAVTNKKLGYDALPNVVEKEEFEEMAKKSTVYYRGVHSGNGKTANEIVNEFKYGNLWTGNSGGAVYGNGVYFTATESIAISEYSGIDGAVFEMIVKKDAKIVDYKEILTEYTETGIPKIIGEKEDYQQILGDLGQYAAVKGYDAIALNGFKNHDYVVLINRGKR